MCVSVSVYLWKNIFDIDRHLYTWLDSVIVFGGQVNKTKLIKSKITSCECNDNKTS